MVRGPTRGGPLLDLVWSSHSDLKVKIGAKIADHATVISTLPDSLETRSLSQRRIWHFRDANWQAMKDAVLNFDCSCLLEGSVDASIDLFVGFLQGLMHAHVPQDTQEVRKATLPWLNSRCDLAIARKHAAEGTPAYAEACKSCSQILYEEKQKHIQKLKLQMEALPKSSKKWWSILKRLLNRQASPSFFPPLKDADGKWVRTPKAKADLFVKSWSAKNILPPEVAEHAFFPVPPGMPSAFPIRPRLVRSLLKKLRLDQATGPDEISALFLRTLAEVLDTPIAILCRRIFTETTWPALWRLHSLVPSHKT